MLPPVTQAPTETTPPPVTLPDLRDDVDTLVTDWERYLRFVDRETTWIAVIGLVLFVLILLLRKPIARLILRAAAVLRRRPFTPDEQQTVDRIVPPLGWLLASGTGLLILRFIRLPGSFETLLALLFHTLTLLAVFVMAYRATHLIGRRLARRDTGQTLLNTNASRYLGTILRAIIVVIGGVTVLSLWFPNITGVIAGVGIGGLLLALAAQDTAANMFAGIAIMLDHPFRIGDWIDTEDASGTVEAIGLRSTRLRAVDRSLITIPNSALGQTPIVNGTTRNARQIVATLYLDDTKPPEDLAAWIETLRHTVPDCPGVHPETTAVHLEGITPHGLALRLAFATDADFAAMLRTREAVLLEVLEQAKRFGVSFARSVMTEA